MAARYNIGQLVQQAFGIKSAFYIPASLTVDIGNINAGYLGIELKEYNYGETETSWMGTPILFPFKILGGQYEQYDRDGKVVLKEIKEFKFPPVTFVDFSRSKIMEETPVGGGDSSVKEIYGFTDWYMKVRIMCLDEQRGGFSAQQYKERILQLENLVDNIEISGSLFSEKGIDSVVIKDISIKDVEASPGVIPIELTMVSDKTIRF